MGSVIHLADEQKQQPNEEEKEEEEFELVRGEDNIQL